MRQFSDARTSRGARAIKSPRSGPADLECLTTVRIAYAIQEGLAAPMSISSLRVGYRLYDIEMLRFSVVYAEERCPGGEAEPKKSAAT